MTIGSKELWLMEVLQVSDIPQGSVSGPLLFVIFINDLPEVLKASYRLFPDDSKIFNRVTNIEQVNYRQTSLDNAVAWAEIFFNFVKCHHLHIGKNNQLTDVMVCNYLKTDLSLKHWLGAYRTNALYSGHIFVRFNDLEDVFT